MSQAEQLPWSWEKFWPLQVFGLIFGLLIGAQPVPEALQVFGVLIAAGCALSIGLGCMVSVGYPGEQLTEHLVRQQLTKRLVLSPNEGIHRSLKNGLRAGVRAGLVFGLLNGLIAGLIGGGFIGLAFGVRAGLGAAIQHYNERYWLAEHGFFPWRAVPFLEDATSRILLRRVGGGYSFAHRLLLDFFADSYSISLPGVPATSVKRIVQRRRAYINAGRTKVTTSADET